MYSYSKILILIFSLMVVGVEAQKSTSDNSLKSQIIELDASNSRFDDLTLLKDQLSYGVGTSMKKISSSNDHLGFNHDKYQQYYKGIKVLGGTYTLHKYRGQTKRMSGNFLNIGDLKVNPKIDANKAVIIARNNTPSNKLVSLADANNSSDLVIYYNLASRNYHLAYRVDVYNQEPVFRADVYVDAHSGKIIDQVEKIHTTDIEAQGMALYDGQVSVMAQSMETNFRLRNTQNRSETYNLANGTDYNIASDISSNDLMFDEDPVAVQAHWGAEQTYQYFMQAHARNSFDGNGTTIKSYVHYSTDYANAFWDGLRMTYGDGNGTTISPLVSLDVVAHEITHGVTQHSAGLIYKYEAGALNESFSDIFAEAVEYFVNGANDWLIGKEIYTNGQAIRSMSNPNLYNDPDTYMGDHWYMGAGDNGGVHTNSGVQNRWFVLLTSGGSGTNDHGESYNVAPLGMEKSAEIAYRNLTVYLGTYSNIYNARQGAIQAAKDLYGESSQEVISVTNAWHAVGVGSKYGDTACKEGEFSIQLTVDNYPEETSWELVDDANNIIASGGLYTDIPDGSTINESLVLDPGNYSFIINDTYGDGICCGYGSGQYELKVGGSVIRRGSYFASSDATEFCIDGELATPDTTPPSQPAGLTVDNITLSSVDVNWNASTDNFLVSGYNVYLDNVFYGFTENTFLSFNGLASNTQYIVGVEAKDDSGNISSRSETNFTTLTPVDNPPSEPFVTVSNITSTSAAVSWEVSSDDGNSIVYHVYLNGTLHYSTAGLATEITSLSPSTTYEIYVQAEDDVSQLSTFTIQSFTTLDAPDVTPPSMPENLIASDITSNSAVISWNPSTDDSGIQLYEIYLDNVLYTSQTSTLLDLTGLAASTQYDVKVRALDNNNIFSIFNTLSFTTLDAPDVTPPSMPENLIASDITSNSAVVSWNESTDDSGIQLYEIYLDNVLYASQTGTFLDLTGLAASTQYNVKVRALDNNNNFSIFNTLSFTTLDAPDVTPPSMPENLRASNITSNSAVVSWDPSTDASGISHYEIYLNDVYYASQTNTTLNLSGLLSSTDYGIRVRAVDNNNNLSIFNSINFTTLEDADITPPSDPQNLIFNDITFESVTATWQESFDASGISHYEIYLNEIFVGNSVTTTFSMDGLDELKTYIFGVKAVDTYSNRSNMVSEAFTTMERPDTEAPTSPGNIAIHSIALSEATAEWDPSSDNIAVTGYNVFLDGEWQNFTIENYYHFEGLTPGTYYEVTVTALDAAGNESIPVSFTFATEEIAVLTDDIIMGSSFETGWEGWIDGGSDSYRYRGRNAIEGRYSIRLRDNSGANSSMTTENLNLTIYDQVLLRFTFMPSSMERNEDFFVEYFDGEVWEIVASYSSKVDFENDNIYSTEIVLSKSEHRFRERSKFRIRCDASSNADKIYVDEVYIIGNPQSSTTLLEGVVSTTEHGQANIFPDEERSLEFTISPNPATEIIKIDFEGEIKKLSIYSLDGKRVFHTSKTNDHINISGLQTGLYIIKVYSVEGRIYQKKLIKSE